MMHRMGVVLDADFFRYSPAVKEKIHRVFRFMYASNFRRRNIFVRLGVLTAIDVSRKMSILSPGLERTLFGTMGKLRQKLKNG
jgi:hypothetical protein